MRERIPVIFTVFRHTLYLQLKNSLPSDTQIFLRQINSRSLFNKTLI